MTFPFSLDVKISLLLDGVKQYRELRGTDLAPYSNISIYPDPVIERFEPFVRTFTSTWPVGDTHIEIKVLL